MTPADIEVAVSTRQTLAFGLLAAAVVGSVLAIGAVHLPVLLVVSALSFAAAAAALRQRALGADGLVVPVPALICGGLAVFTLLQALPLPVRFLSALSPVTADVWARCLLPFGEQGPRFASLSLDPGASMVEALKWATYAAVFAAAAAISARHGAGRIVSLVFGSAVAAALVTVGHGLTEATTVYGLYQPLLHAGAWHVGPLLNPNNLSGYLNLGALAGLGLMLGERPALPRWLTGVGVALLVGVDVITASRGGVLSLLVGVAALGIIMRRRRGGPSLTRRMSAGMIGAVVVSGAVFAILGSSTSTWTELYDKDLSKLSMMLWVKPLVREHALFGVGRGAFESAFPVYRTVPGNLVFTYAENFVAQWLAEWGLPVTLLALGAFAWSFAPRRFGVQQRALAAGVWCGLGALLLQNLVDLGLEIPAIPIALSAALGAVWADPSLARNHALGLRIPGPLAPRGTQRVVALVGGVGAALIAGALAFGWHDVGTDRREAQRALAASAPGSAAGIAPVRRLLHQAMLRHPAEPYFALVGASAVFRARTESPIPWLQRSLERAPVNGRAHLLLAEVLSGLGSRAQALLELRLAIEDDPGVAVAAATQAVRWTKSFDELSTMVPEGRRGAAELYALGSVLWTRAAHQPGRAAEVDLARRCNEEAIRRDPQHVPARTQEAQELTEALATPGSPLCADRARCDARVNEDADAIAAVDPASIVPTMLRAHLLLAEDRPEDAALLLEKACERADERVSCLQLRVAAAAKIKAPAAIDAASKELLGASCLAPTACADMVTWVANVRRGRGENGLALSLLARAAREEPGNEARWLRLADAASQAGQHGQALDALEKVARRHGAPDPALRQRMDAERAQALGGMMAIPR